MKKCWSSHLDSVTGLANRRLPGAEAHLAGGEDSVRQGDEIAIRFDSEQRTGTQPIGQRTSAVEGQSDAFPRMAR